MRIDINELPAQPFRSQFASAIVANDFATVEELLTVEPLLANADLRAASDRDDFSSGLPLHLACQLNHADLAELLLNHGAHADAPGRNPDSRPVHGMPLHFAAADHRNYRLANLLLDRGATPSSYPNCDKATIERMFYRARRTGMSDAMVRRSFASYLPDQTQLEMSPITAWVESRAAESIKLFARMVDLGAHPPLKVLVRESMHDLAMEIVDHSHGRDAAPQDHPCITVLESVSDAAKWYGYPGLLRNLMRHPSYQYCYEDAIGTIGVAIGSHNRDGEYKAYRQIIVMQLEELQRHGDVRRAKADEKFQPLYQLATDFTWHRNYGYRAEIASPDCYIDLAELCVEWGFDDIEYRDPQSGHSPLSAAVARGHHPGIDYYIRWLLDRGADLRKNATADVNPMALAKNHKLAGIALLLDRHCG